MKGTDDGIWRRRRCIPFEACFEGANEVKGLGEILDAELDGILAWMIQGCLDWQAHGLPTPAAVASATKEYRADSDPIAQFIESECDTSHPANTCATSILYKRFQEWREMAGVSSRITLNKFGRRLTSRNFVSDGDKNGAKRLGIKLRATADE